VSLRIVVCVKQVPDTAAERSLGADGRLDRGASEAVLNVLDEYAVEEGLRLAEAHGGEVTVVSMGPAGAVEAVRRALSMGADRGVVVADEGLAGSDAVGTSLVLAAVVGREGFDLVVLGAESTDARMGVVPAMLAERLGVAQLTLASRVEVAGDVVRVRRVAGGAAELVEGRLPAVVSVVEKVNEPRYPSFKGIMAARRKPVAVVGLGELGVDGGLAGLAGAGTEVVRWRARPPREAGEVVADEGQGGVALAAFLAGRKFI
jgi:electron transfer flavoprotein beta subunit